MSRKCCGFIWPRPNGTRAARELSGGTAWLIAGALTQAGTPLQQDCCGLYRSSGCARLGSFTVRGRFTSRD
jgi:hypothetical protein